MLSHRRSQITSALVAAFLAVGLSPDTSAAVIPPAGKAVKLFNGKNFDGLEIFVKDRALNDDLDHIFRVEHGLLHVSGEVYGWAATTKEYRDYYLRAEFKWGAGTFPPRKGQARDSGILYHMTGPHKIWPNAIEFQIMEGATGDIIILTGPEVTARGETKKTGRFDRLGKGAFTNVTGFRDPATEIEKPHGEWNVVELVADGNRITYWVNGKFVNEATATVDHGKIMFQSEGAEVYFRKMELRPLKKPKTRPAAVTSLR